MREAREEERNARLRRADWRFLLPSPRPGRVLSRAGGALGDAVASIAEEVVTASAGGDCDLAIAENPDREALAALHAALRPGGTCYTEWDGVIGSAAEVTRALVHAGFDEVTCYRRWPAGDSPLYWIPIGAPGATGYVRARSRLRGGRVRRLLGSARAAVRGLLRGHLGGPISAVARRGGAAMAGPAAWLREQWPTWRLGPTPDHLSLLLATGGPRSVSKVVLLAFAEPSPRPVLVVKAPRVEEAAAGVRRESRALEYLERRGPVPGTPRPLGLREIGGVPLLGETALLGRPLDTVLTRGSLKSRSVAVTDWLAALGRGGPTRSAAHWRDAIVEPAFARFVEAFEAVVDPGLLRQGEAIVRAIGDLPAVPEQRDLGPWNVLTTSSGELAVLDWESAEVEGLPALDLLYYLAYASFQVDRAWDGVSRITSFRRSLDPSSTTGAVRRDCLARYFAALGLDPAQLAPLRVLVWLIHAQSDVRHATADAGGSPSREQLARSLFLGLWTEEVRRLAGR